MGHQRLNSHVSIVVTKIGRSFTLFTSDTNHHVVPDHHVVLHKLCGAAFCQDFLKGRGSFRNDSAERVFAVPAVTLVTLGAT